MLLKVIEMRKKKRVRVRGGVRTHALIRVPELKSGALDHSATLTVLPASALKSQAAPAASALQVDTLSSTAITSIFSISSSDRWFIPCC